MVTDIEARERLAELLNLPEPMSEELLAFFSGYDEVHNWREYGGDFAPVAAKVKSVVKVVENELMRRRSRESNGQRDTTASLVKLNPTMGFELTMRHLLCETVKETLWVAVGWIASVFSEESEKGHTSIRSALAALIREDRTMAEHQEARQDPEKLKVMPVPLKDGGLAEVDVLCKESRLAQLQTAASLLGNALDCSTYEAMLWAYDGSLPQPVQICKTRAAPGTFSGSARIVVEASVWATEGEVGRAFSKERSKHIAGSCKRPQLGTLVMLTLAYGFFQWDSWAERYRRYCDFADSQTIAHSKTGLKNRRVFKHHCESLRRRLVSPNAIGPHAGLYGLIGQFVGKRHGAGPGRPRKSDR